MNTPIIVGAGISGLSAANYFVDNGIYPIIIEADTIGKVKVCGEFFSCESIAILNKWEIPFLSIKKANFSTSKNKYSFDLPSIAASTSRSICELELSRRATKLGAQLFTNTFIQEIIPSKSNSDLHYIKLSSGQILETDKLIITTSKLFLSSQKKLNSQNYIGIKAHFTNIDMPNELNMYLIDGAYMGLTYIDNSKVNICCLAKKETIDKHGSIDSFMNYFFSSNIELSKLYKSATKLSDNWLSASIKQFGKKSIPNWPNTYFIGDAIATIYPAAGNGLAMGLTSGIMAAEHIITNSKNDFNTAWNSRYSNRLHHARILHSFFISEQKSKVGFKLANLFPRIANYFYKFTRDYY